MTTYTATQVRKLRHLAIRAGYAKDGMRDRYEVLQADEAPSAVRRSVLDRHVTLARRHDRLAALLSNVA